MHCLLSQMKIVKHVLRIFGKFEFFSISFVAHVHSLFDILPCLGSFLLEIYSDKR
ncbi:hypothetical protein Bca4012_060862 [Brassica carinata]